MLPITEMCDGGEGSVRGGSGESGGSEGGSRDNLLNMTRAKSLEVVVPTGD